MGASMLVLIPFILIIVVVSFALLWPETFINAIQFRVHPAVRTQPSAIAPVAVAVLFVFGFWAFHSVPGDWQFGRVNFSDPLQRELAFVAGVLFLLVGGLACLRPLRFIGMSSPLLRKMSASEIGAGSMARIQMVSRTFGIFFLLASAFLLQQFLGAT